MFFRTYLACLVAVMASLPAAADARDRRPNDPLYGSPVDSWDNQLEARRHARREENERRWEADQQQAEAQAEAYRRTQATGASIRRIEGGARQSEARFVSRWDYSWRQNRSYDWLSWRRRDERRYRMPDYVSPYPRDSYSRPQAGSRLRSLYYDIRYWIPDPAQYRLPRPAPESEWVRYHSDVLLVDFRSGIVMDAVHDFFL